MSLYKYLEPRNLSADSVVHCTKTKNSTISLLSAGAIAVTTLLVASAPVPVYADAIGPLSPYERAQEALRIRTEAAESNFLEPLPDHPNNGDEETFSGKGINPAKEFQINSYTKGLPHNEYGVVKQNAYEALINALHSGDPADFEKIPMGEGEVLLRNPQAAYTYLMEGKDPHSYTMPAAPAFSSAQQASEAIEVLWQALTRDIPYNQYGSDLDIKTAAADMSRFSDFRGPKDNGEVTPGTLFRGIGNKETIGPYISQFLLKPIPFGATTVEQLYDVPVPGNDHLTNYKEWLHIQNGGKPTGITKVNIPKDYPPHYIYSGRAMAQFVLKDFVNQSYLAAARIIGSYGSAALDANNPYNTASETRGPLFGTNHVIDLLSRVSMGSQNVAWYQKWLVHRRARPEVFFGRVHNHLTKPGIDYPIHQELFESPALEMVYNRNGTYLLPTATPDGSPLHPTYPAGHAVMAGAAVTMLKAFFNEDYVIENPVTTNDEGTALVPYVAPAGEPPLTIESELNKLASNISLGRDIAGVHYRTDGDLGIALGEKYGISILEELVETYNEDFEGFFLRKFDGTEITIGKKR